MPHLHPDRLAAGGSIEPPRDDTDDLEPRRAAFVIIMLSAALWGVIAAAVWG